MEPSQPDQQPNPRTGNTPETQPVLPSGPQVIPLAFAANQPRPKRRKLLIAVLAVTLVSGLVIAGLLFFNRQSNSKQPGAANADTNSNKQDEKKADAPNTIVPSDWQTVDTTLGFSVKAPVGWTAAFSAEATINNLKTKSVSLLGPEASTSDPTISASQQSLTDASGRAAFEAAVNQLNPDTLALLEQMGFKKEEVTLKASHVTLGGKQWLQVDTEYPGQITRTFYLWNNDHAVALTLLTDSATVLREKSKSYLEPMATSAIVGL